MAAKKRSSKKEAETQKPKASAKKTAKKEIEQKPVPVLSEEMIDNLKEKISELESELDKSMRFAAAAKRARKMTTDLQQEFKDFRKASVEFWKKG